MQHSVAITDLTPRSDQYIDIYIETYRDLLSRACTSEELGDVSSSAAGAMFSFSSLLMCSLIQKAKVFMAWSEI